MPRAPLSAGIRGSGRQERGSDSAAMPLAGKMMGRYRRTAWAALAIAAAAVAGVVAVVANLWGQVGSAQISAAGWIAMALGVLVTLALGIGLMSLVFISSRRGYDEAGGDRVDRRG